MKRVSLLPGLLALAAVVFAQNEARLARVQAAVDKYMAEKKVTGASVAIAEKGVLVYQNGFGLADVEHDSAAKADTVYRLGSVSKVVTAVAILQLVEQGKIDLDADIRTYVPEFPDNGAKITARHLLAHTSGIRHYRPLEVENTKSLPTVVAGFSRFAADPLVHAPGEKFTYSTYAFNLLARAVETASGSTFKAYLADKVWGPSGAMASGLEDLRSIVKNRARGYWRLPNGELANSEFADISYKWAGGGMVSTAPDLCRFGMALLSGKLMRNETFRLMTSPQKLNDGSTLSQSLGWATGAFQGKPFISHSGAQQAARSFFAIHPEDQLVVACLTNYESHNPRDLGIAVRDAWYGTSRLSH